MKELAHLICTSSLLNYNEETNPYWRYTSAFFETTSYRQLQTTTEYSLHFKNLIQYIQDFVNH